MVQVFKGKSHMVDPLELLTTMHIFRVRFPNSKLQPVESNAYT